VSEGRDVSVVPVNVWVTLSVLRSCVAIVNYASLMFCSTATHDGRLLSFHTQLSQIKNFRLCCLFAKSFGS
jgi:hypothetical protein